MIVLPVMYYVDALRTWAQRVSRERFPAHVELSVDGHVRLEGWLRGGVGDELMVLLECLRNAWDASDSLAEIGHVRIADNVLTITTTQPGVWRSFGVATIPPSPWRPRHLLAWLVLLVLRHDPRGWAVIEHEVKP